MKSQRNAGIAVLIIGLIVLITSILSLAASDRTSSGVVPPPNPAPAPQTTDAISSIDPAQIESALRAAVGPAIDSQSVNAAIGLTTGALDSDPGRQQAERTCAAEALNHFLVPGDQVSLFGYETAIDPGAVWALPVNDQSRKQLAADLNSLPSGPGGIRFAPVIDSAANQLNAAQNHNTVLILISSFDGDEDPVTTVEPAASAANDPTKESQHLNQIGVRRLAAFPVSYTDTKTLPGGAQTQTPRRVFVTLVIPTQFEGTPLADLRSHLLGTGHPLAVASGQSPVNTGSDTNDHRPKNMGGIIACVFALLLILAGLGIVFGSGQPVSAVVITVVQPVTGNGRYGLIERNGALICRLVGPDPAPSKDPVMVIGTAASAVPKIVFAEIINRKSKLVMESAYTITDDAGTVSGGPIELRPHRPYSITISGRSSADRTAPPQPFTLKLEVLCQ